MKKFTAILLLLSILLMTACSNNSLDETSIADGTAQSSDVTYVDEELTLVKGAMSEYVIICNYKDSVGRDFANDLWDFMYITFGVSLDTKSESSSYDKEIIVGNTGREATLSVKAQMKQENDFAVCAFDDDLVMYATDRIQYGHLLVALRDYIFAGTDTSELKFSKEKNFIASLNPDMNFEGNEVLFMDNYACSYSIVYGDGNSESMTYAVYLKQYLNEVFGINVPILADSKKADKEIIIKGANRSALKTAEKKLDTADDFLASISGDDILLSATDNGKMMLAMMYLVKWCTTGFGGTQIKLNESDGYIYSKDGRAFEYSVKELCERYQDVYNTYSSYHEDKLYNTSWLPQSAKEDQALVIALIDRMGKAFAVSNGSSSVLYNGYIHKLDKSDYARSAIISGSTVKIPKEFAESYFGTSISADGNGYVDITSYISGNTKYSVYISSDSCLAIIIPSGVASFSNGNTKVGKYTNTQYCNRMKEFFNSSVIPEPAVNAEQSRVVVEYIEYPEYVLDFKTNKYQTTYSPGIVVVNEGGNSVYYVSYEISTVCDYEELSTYTVVKKSTDGGKSWDTVVEKIPDLRWASPFENKGTVYLLGSDIYTGAAMIVQIGNNGQYKMEKLFGVNDASGSAPGTVLHANGRIYKAYQTATISASETSNLMLASSWTLSNKTNTEELALTGAEGSMVLGKDGGIYQVMHTDKTQTAFVLKLSADGTTYTGAYPLSGNVVSFPTCISKTSVIYDSVSEKYIALSNICNTTNQRQRNVLALVVSDDLYHWEISEYILVEREMINPLYSTTVHAYQYTDFKIDGDDIVMVVREASGYTNTYHDGNYTTFYRIDNFRALLDNARGEYPS